MAKAYSWVSIAGLVVPILLFGAPASGAGEGAPARPVELIVGFFEIPEEVRGGTYRGNPVTGLAEELKFALVVPKDSERFREEIVTDAAVRYVEVNEMSVHASLVPNDPHYGTYQYDMKPATTNIQAAWDRSLGATSVEVCVTDTGLINTHEDFNTLSVGAWKDFVAGKTSRYDDNGHGTHVTGTIAANINNGKGVAGIAQVTINSAKVLNKAGSGTLAQVGDGIRWCADQGSHVISMSLGTTSDSTTVRDAVQYAYNAGSLLVAAAGNGGCTNCIEYPGKYAEVIAVTCTDSANALCSFSSTGPEAEIAAPGVDIASTYIKLGSCRKNCYALSDGTSMSTPHVAGVAALIKTTHSGYSRDDLRSTLQTTAKDLGAVGRDNNFGYGLLQGSGV